MPDLGQPETQALATAVREIRARQRLKQEEVSARGGLGRKYVSAVERGELAPSFAAIVALAKGLDVPVSEIVRVYEERLGS